MTLQTDLMQTGDRRTRPYTNGTVVREAHEFRDAAIHDVIVRPIQSFSDERGWLTEIFRNDELLAAFHPQMAYISQTLPGVVRGPHEHRQQTDYFVFLGPGTFEVFLWDARPGSPTWRHRQVVTAGESAKQVVVIPPGVVHAYRNVSQVPAWSINAPNRLFAGPGRSEPVDEIRHENDPRTPYVLPSSLSQASQALPPG